MVGARTFNRRPPKIISSNTLARQYRVGSVAVSIYRATIHQHFSTTDHPFARVGLLRDNGSVGVQGILSAVSGPRFAARNDGRWGRIEEAPCLALAKTLPVRATLTTA
jgi:hypothetical protein